MNTPRAGKGRTRRSLILVGLGFVLGGTIYLAAGGSGAPIPRSPDDKGQALGHNDPNPVTSEQNYCDGRSVTKSEARRSAGFDPLEPHHPLANDSTLEETLLCPGDMIAIRYSSGVKITQEKTTLSDPTAAWVALAAQDPGVVTVGKIRGEPASLSDPEKDLTGTAAGGVELVENGVQITVIGNGEIPIEDLESVTESLN